MAVLETNETYFADSYFNVQGVAYNEGSLINFLTANSFFKAQGNLYSVLKNAGNPTINFKIGRQGEKSNYLSNKSFSNTHPFQYRLASNRAFFGNGFKQNVHSLYFNKHDFEDLTPLENNTAESLLVAILLKALYHLASAQSEKLSIEIFSINFQAINNQPKVLTTLLINIFTPLVTYSDQSTGYRPKYRNIDLSITPMDMDY